MGCDTFEIGIRDQGGRMLLRSWTKDKVLASMPWLKRENAKGADVYVRPASKDGQNAGIVLVDDLSRQSLAKMQAQGFAPACITETSPDNFQAWVRLQEEPVPPKVATSIASAFAERFDGDPNSADWRHFGRLAGLTNQKPIHRNKAGRSPYVLAHDSNGKPARRGKDLVNHLLQEFEKSKKQTESQNRQQGIKNAAETHETGQPIPKPTLAYQEGLKRLKTRFGENLDFSRADYMIAKAMAQQGFKPEEVVEALKNASPALQARKAGHTKDYIERTLRAAYNASERHVSKSLQTKPKEPSQRTR